VVGDDDEEMEDDFGSEDELPLKEKSAKNVLSKEDIYGDEEADYGSYGDEDENAEIVTELESKTLLTKK